MNVGRIIKYHRLQNNLTQLELSEGICSVSHLSKIENNSKEVDTYTLNLLLDKLDLSEAELEQSYAFYKSLLDKFLDAIYYYEKEKTEKLHEELSKLEELITATDLVYNYHLYTFKYYLFIGNIKKANEKMSLLTKFYNVFSQHEKDIFNNLDALLYLQKGDYKRSLDILKKYEESNYLSFRLPGEYYYHISLNYSYLNNSVMSVTYGQKALQEFSNSCNYIRIIHTQLLLAIHYTEMNLFVDASKKFEHMLRNASLIGEDQLLPTIHHNYGILFSKMKRYENALQQYQLAMGMSQSKDHYYISLSNYAEILIKLSRKEEAIPYIKEIIANSDNDILRKYNLISKYYLLRYEGKEKKSINILEKHLIPYLEKNDPTKDYLKYLRYLAYYYSNKDTYKSNFYYCLLHDKENEL